jgi:hypothetical protein
MFCSGDALALPLGTVVVGVYSKRATGVGCVVLTVYHIPGVFNARPVDWISAARPFFRSVGAIFPVVKKMKAQKRNR